jgi:tetratricopeptide (TPR) repeat protein
MRQLLPLALLAACWSAPVRSQTVLVLPFSNESSSANLDWIGESVCQTVSEALAAQGFLVLDREDRQEAFRRLSIRPDVRLTHATVIRIAEALDADQVAYGQFQFTPPAAGAPEGSRGSLAFTAWTLSMRQMRQEPAFVESGSLDSLASLQSRLAWQVLGALDPEGTPPLEQFQKQHPPVRLDAMENYTRGLLAGSPELKHRYFAQAARLDPGFAGPTFQLGRLYWRSKEYRLAAQWFAKVEPGAQRYMEANFLLGLCHYYMGDYADAQKAFELVAQAVPLNEVLNNLGAAESKRGLPGALSSFRKALDGDPNDPDYQFNTGYALWKEGKFAEAADRFRALLDRDPDDAQATLLLGRCLARSGPREGEIKEGYERVKLNYEEGAWRQLKAALAGKKPR